MTTSDNDTELSNRFSNCFLGKIQTIRNNLQKANETNDNVVNVLRADVKFNGRHLTRLAPASSDEIRKLLVKLPSTQCLHIYLNSVNNVLPVITAMVNKSLNGISVSTAFKETRIGYEQP